MRFRLLFIALIAALLFPTDSFAQLDTREPGIYAIVNGESIPLRFTKSRNRFSFRSWFNVKVVSYKGAISGIETSNIFVLVNDPEQNASTASKPFFVGMSPDNLGVIPLAVDFDAQIREFISGTKGTNYYGSQVAYERSSLDFEFEQISANSFKIRIPDLLPGEYGFYTSTSQTNSNGGYNYGIFGFTIPEDFQEDSTAFANCKADYKPIPEENLTPEQLREGGFLKRNNRMILGYVNKSWIATYPSVSQMEDFFGDGGKLLHGFQIGWMYTPSFNWGLGLRTGVLFEVYLSKSKTVTNFCHHFAEIDFYVPLHLSYRFPISRRSSVDIYAGPGFQLAAGGQYMSANEYLWNGWRRPGEFFGLDHKYGNGWPERINWQADLGVEWRKNNMGLGFTYSFGLVDHHLRNSFDSGKSFETASKSRQDKMQFSWLLFF